jgi:hypothetical protein
VSGFVVYGLVQYLFFPRANALLVWMLLGAVATLDSGPRCRRSERIGLALVAIALVLLPLRALLWEKPPSRGDRSFGFHAVEAGHGASYQWTAAEHAMRRLSWEDEVLVLKIANGHPRASVEPISVEILVDGAIVEQAVLGEGWHQIRIELGPPTKETILLGFEVDQTFRPFSEYREDDDLPDSRDLRRLGIAVRDIGWQPAPKIERLPAR